MGDFYLKKIEKRFFEYVDSGTKVYFSKTELKADSGLIGALELLFEN